MNRIQQLLIENENRPEIQKEIRKAAINGAKSAGYKIGFEEDNSIYYKNKKSYLESDEACYAAWERIQEDVDLS